MVSNSRMKPQQIIARARYSLCQQCPHLRPVLKTCRQCGCFMPAKTRLMWAKCPIGTWDKMSKDAARQILAAAVEDSE